MRIRASGLVPLASLAGLLADVNAHRIANKLPWHPPIWASYRGVIESRCMTPQRRHRNFLNIDQLNIGFDTLNAGRYR